MEKLKVSIIIPLYNVEEYIEETLESIINQTMDNFEIIIIDDGSTDKSSVIIERYLKMYNNINYIYQKNSGPGKARNRGLEIARGEYIVFVDSDDILPEDAILKRYNDAKQSNADIAVCATHLYDGEKDWPIKNHFFKEGDKYIERDFELLWMMGPCNKIYKRETIKNIRFPENINYGEDQVFVLRSYLEANKIYSSQYVGYYYRMRKDNGGSLTQQVFVDPAKVIDNIAVLWKFASSDIELRIKDDNVKKMIKNAYFYRLANVNIWPAFKEAIIGDKRADKYKVFESMKNLLKTVDKSQLRNLGKIKKNIFKTIYDNRDCVLNKNLITKITVLVYFSCKAAKIKGLLKNEKKK